MLKQLGNLVLPVLPSEPTKNLYFTLSPLNQYSLKSKIERERANLINKYLFRRIAEALKKSSDYEGMMMYIVATRSFVFIRFISLCVYHVKVESRRERIN